MNKAQEDVDSLVGHWCRQVVDLEDNTEAVLLAVDNTDTAEDNAVACVQSDTGGQGVT